MNTPHRLILSALAIALGALTVCATPALASPGLPDGRVYELVSAANQEGDVYSPLAESNYDAGEGSTDTKLPFQTAPDGEAFVYVGDPSVGGVGNAGDGLGEQYMATRKSSGGWTQVTLQPAGVVPAYYQAFSRNLSVGVLESEQPLSANAPEGFAVLYTSSESEPGYRPLFTITPVEPALEFTTYGVPLNFFHVGSLLVYAGESADSSESLFEVHGALTANAVDSPGANNLYVSTSGRLSLVDVAPDGESEPSATFGSLPLVEGRGNKGNPPDFSHDISEDGSRIFWSGVTSGDLYARLNPTSPQSPLSQSDECTVATDACTVQLDAAEPGAQGSGGGGRFLTASENGAQVFFTDEHRLTQDATAVPGAPDLYEYDFDKPLGARLSDLTVTPAGEPAAVQGLLGASEDGSYIYFVAQGELASNENDNGASAQPGEDNLYVLHQGSAPRFIATLSDRDDTHAIVPGPEYEFGDWQPSVGHRTAEVTPDGASVVFESNNQTISGYSPKYGGKDLEEVYDYNAASERLTCVSCEQSGEAPRQDSEAEVGLGAFLPPSWSYTYQPTWISEDGDRVFFDSAQPLVARDTNETQDVYEWEQEGTPGCADGSGMHGGCIYLLSDGINQSAAWLAGASASGNDVFIITPAKLVPEAQNEAYKLFDARVGGLESPVPPACAGTGCQGVPATPPVFATPASGTFEGVGNFPPPKNLKAPPRHKTKKRHKRLPKRKRPQNKRGGRKR